MIKELLGAAILGTTLVAVPAGAATAHETTTAAVSARQDSFSVRIHAERRGGRGRVMIRVHNARTRERVRFMHTCLHMRVHNTWTRMRCERTDRRGEARWFVRADHRRVYRIAIPGNREYRPYFSDMFRIPRR